MIAPSMVNNLTCTPVSPTQVNISWSRPSQPNGVIRQYEVIIDDINTPHSVTKLVYGQTTSTTVENLVPTHNYSCSVAAHTVTRGSLTTIARVQLSHFSMLMLITITLTVCKSHAA